MRYIDHSRFSHTVESIMSETVKTIVIIEREHERAMNEYKRASTSSERARDMIATALSQLVASAKLTARDIARVERLDIANTSSVNVVYAVTERETERVVFVVDEGRAIFCQSCVMCDDCAHVNAVLTRVDTSARHAR